MKRILLATVALTALSIGAPALAADMAPAYTKAPPMAPMALYNWTGFYIGGHIGGGWGDQGSTELDPGTVAFPTGTVFTGHDTSGFLGGVQAGFNWQASNIVVGIEGEYSWADLTGSSSTVSLVNGVTSTSSVKTKDIAMVTGRLGYAASNWLLYVKGGGAWAQGNSNGNVFLANGTFFESTSSSTDRSGWVVGVGVEWGFAPNWSAKLEYDHLDFGSTNVTINTSLATQSFVRSSETIDMVKAGVNYRFNWGPMATNY